MYTKGLGFAPIMALSASGGPVGLAIGAAISLGLTILSTLRIGSGRKEADAITPVANSLVNPQRTGRLDELSDQFTASNNVPELQNILGELDWIKQTYNEFLNDPGFTDGRASKQARADMFPLIEDIIKQVSNKILSLFEPMASPIPTQGYGSAVPRLEVPNYFPLIPQAGTLPPYASSPLRPNYIQPVSRAGFGLDNPDMLLLGGCGVLAWLLLSRKEK